MVIEKKGMLFRIQRFSLDDGPGIRTTVFLKGCMLRCRWCHNPESYEQKPTLSYFEHTCINCGTCERICRSGGHHCINNRHLLRRERCVGCGACALACPASALQIIGFEASPDEVLEEIKKDIPFYRQSKGGVTLSGGEPLMQPEFSKELLSKSRQAGIHTAVETCGMGAWESMEALAPYTDLWLFDVKETDGQRMKAYTGGALDQVMSNLERLSARGASIILRAPIVKTVNDRRAHFDKLKELKARFCGIRAIEVMPYHVLGSHKAVEQGIGQERYPVPDVETIAMWRRWVE